MTQICPVDRVTACVRGYEEACSTLLAMALTGGFWAEEEHYSAWQRALQHLVSRTPSSGSGSGVSGIIQDTWLELQRYPATLLLYALGLGAIEAESASVSQTLAGYHTSWKTPG